MVANVITILGTTASGKSSLGIELARIYGGEIVSADSRQVYRHLDLGTGKVTADEMRLVRHHLINILDLNEPFSLAEYQCLAYKAIDEILSEGKLPFLVGGTGLYSRAVTDGYTLSDVPPDEKLRSELAEKSIDELKATLSELGCKELPANTSSRRMIRMIEKLKNGVTAESENAPRYRVLKLGMTCERDELYRRIAARLDARIEQGMIEEVRNVLALGATPEFLEGLGLEYRYTYRYITGGFVSKEDYRNELYRAICRFAKRQVTWFKKEKDVHWLDCTTDCTEAARELIDAFLFRSSEIQ